MKRKYVWHNGTFVDVTDWRPAPRKTPYIIRDAMDAVQHPATGQMFDSKSRFREVTKAHGLVEIGNESPKSPKVPTEHKDARKKAISEAYEAVAAGYTSPPSESLADWGETRMYEAP